MSPELHLSEISVPSAPQLLLTRRVLLDQGVPLLVIKELLGYAHIGITAGVYAHGWLRLQRQVIDALCSTDDDPPIAAAVR